MNLGNLEDNLEAPSDQTSEDSAERVSESVSESEAAESSLVEEPKSRSAQPVRASEGSNKLEPTREGMKWYVLRVASNKEEQVRDALERKVRIEVLQDRIGRVLVPTLKEKRMKGGQVKVIEKKLYPGYVFVEMATDPDGSIPENIWFMVKETMGVGDFIGSDGKPTSMKEHDVEMMLLAAAKPEEEASIHGMEFSRGDRVKIKEGSFENYEGNVDTIDEAKGIVTVLLTIFGRATPVDVEYWQLEKL
ncbi:MAG: transcription termination/antitermination protein NusG [Planctomycetota bacterium]|jgi:transcriptional antiterminator NusG